MVKQVAVIGAGIAGLWTANALASRGVIAIVLERASAFGTKASGNKEALVMPYIGSSPSTLQWQFYTPAFRWAVQCLQARKDGIGDIFSNSGVLQLPATARLNRITTRHESTNFGSYVSSSEASRLSGIRLEAESIYIQEAGVLEPARLLENLRTEYHDLVSVIPNFQVVGIDEGCDGVVSVTSNSGQSVTAEAVVVCAAFESSAFFGDNIPVLEPIRGETLLVAATPMSKALRVPLVFDGYISPANDGVHCVGSHYRHHDMNEDPDLLAQSSILHRAAKWSPHFNFGVERITYSRVCFRTSTHDRLPYVGPVRLEESDNGRENIFINAGHGARGFVSSAISAEIIARQICKEPLGELAEVARLVSPQRNRSGTVGDG